MKKSDNKRERFSTSNRNDRQLTDEQASYEAFLDWLTEPVDNAEGMTSELPFEEPSSDALKRYSAVPLMSITTSFENELAGRVEFDSWASAPQVPLRDIIPGHVRRLKLKAGRITLEIVAEKSTEGWEFVARAYKGQKVIQDRMIKIGSRKMLAKSGGFFVWNSKSVPKSLKLQSFDQTLLFEGLKW